MNVSALATAVVVLASPGLAFAGPFAIDTSACPSLDAEEIDRRVRVELADVATAQEGAGSLRVTFTCNDAPKGMATVVISDPITDKRVERTVPLPPKLDRERVLALVAAQLFTTSWLELLTHPSPDARPAPRDPPPAALTDRALERANAEAGSGGRARGIELAVGGLADLRSLGSGPIFLGGGFVRPGFFLGDHLRLDLASSFATGHAARTHGAIDATVFGFGLGLGYRSSGRASVAFEGHALASLAYARVVGTSDSPGFGDATARGFFADFSLAFGPSVRIGASHLALEALGGLALPKLRAAVEGDHDIVLSGAFVGARLTLAAGWGGS